MLSLQTELENECDHLNTFMDLETLGIMRNKEQIFETTVNEVRRNENGSY